MRVLGIDAGGTKTTAFLADADGGIVGEGRAGGANLQAHGELEVEKVLHGVIDLALGDRPVMPAAVCLGLAGVDRKDDAQVIRDIMKRLGFRSHTVIVNDALIALVAGSGGIGPRLRPDSARRASSGSRRSASREGGQFGEAYAGVVLVSGTGSIAYGVNRRGVAARAGGWGSSLGDEGSGYWIGRRALVAVVRDADGRGPRTALTPMVLEHFGLSRPEQLVAEIYDNVSGRRAIASLGATVERARAEGDLVAIEILRDAATELAMAASSVVTRLEMRGEQFPTWLSGGLLTGVPWLATEVARHLAEVAPRSVVAPLTVEPAMGAVRLALAEAQGGVQVPVYVDPLAAGGG